MEGRLTVLETQQTALQAENGRLKGDLKAEVASLEYQLQKFVNGQILLHCISVR